MKRVFLSLGSNRGNKIAYIKQALQRLGSVGVEVRRVSPLYRTEPVDFRSQPWFVNCVAEVATELLPLQLLGKCRAVERALGRRPGAQKGPRPIDIDILLYENVVLRSAALTIPHQRMPERRFVLVPLRDLAADVRHPVTRQTVSELLYKTPDASQVSRLKEE